MITTTLTPSRSAPTIEQTAHIAAAAYRMKHAGATSLVVVEDLQSRRRIGLITEADLVEAAAESMDGTTFGSET
jgi:signal-transduction protein with cAMP-binding, CBS, and nucleotidyltransferase domain